MRELALLGPQRLRPRVDDVLTRLGVEGPVATVTAGWEEREREDDELARHLGGRSVNLELFSRYEDVLASDDALRAAAERRRTRLQGLRRLYRMRLRHAMEAGWSLLRSDADPALLGPEQESAIEAIRALDEHHLARVRDIELEFAGLCRPHGQSRLDEHRHAVTALLGECSALVIAGGHVGVLGHILRVFDLPGCLDGGLFGPTFQGPLVAWSGGAMVLAERVALFHDRPPWGPGSAEVLGPGLGLYDDVIPLPHARRRLRLDDPIRVGLLARRFAPRAAIAMDEAAILRHDGRTWHSMEGARRLTDDGSVVGAEPEACAP